MKFSAAVCLVFLYAPQHFEAAQNSKLKSASAIALDPKIINVHYCYVKALARNFSTLNFGLTFVQPVEPFYVIAFGIWLCSNF